MSTPWAVFQPIDQALARPSSRTVRGAAAIPLGWCSLLGGLIGSVNLVVPGALIPGLPTVVFAGLMILLVVVGAFLLKVRRAGEHLVTGFVLTALPMYVVVSQCVVDAATYAPPLMMLFGAVTGAVMLGVRAFIVNCLMLVIAVAITLTPTWPSSTTGLIVQIFVQSAILVVTSVGILLLRRRAEALLEHSWRLARNDSLTGLANRFGCAEYVEGLAVDTPLAFIAIDLDHFKAVNDTHGHEVGDQVLQSVALIIRSACPDGFPARIGGEEFLVLHPVESELHARQLATRLNRAVRLEASPVPVTCSVGVTDDIVPAKGSRTDWLWHQVSDADRALYRAKQAGRDQIMPRQPTSAL